MPRSAESFAGAGAAGLAAVLSEVAAALEEERADPVEPPPRLVRRRCPFCHDALGAEARVLCAGCVTPHHAGCFSEHGGCALLGCGTTRSLDPEGPSARILCSACSELTPSNGSFCAKCGARHSERPTPRRARLIASLCSSAALLLVPWSLGATLGAIELRAREVALHEAERGVHVQRRAALHRHLQAIQRAQVLFARYDLDGDGELDYAESATELSSALRAACEFETSTTPRLSEARWDLERAFRWGSQGWDIALGRDAAGRQVAMGRIPREESSGWTCDLEGRLERVSERRP